MYCSFVLRVENSFCITLQAHQSCTSYPSGKCTLLSNEMIVITYVASVSLINTGRGGGCILGGGRFNTSLKYIAAL